MIKREIMGRTELGLRTVEGCAPDPKLGWSSEGDLVHSREINTPVQYIHNE